METYLAYNKNNNIRKQSSSGGIFYECAKYILDNKGIVFGAAWNNEWLVDMISIDNIDDLPKLMKSKYVQANNKNTFEECKQYLDHNKLVLYSGTPCQIMSLKKYLIKNYDNLYTIEVACEGLPPTEMWKDYLETKQRPNVKIIDINMRDKENTTWNHYNFTITYSDNEQFKEEHNNNKFLKAFISAKYMKKSCLNCVAKANSKAELTIGDWWCVEKYHAKIDSKDGISFIRVNNPKGNILLQKIKNNIELTPTNIENIKKHNSGVKPINNIKQEVYNKNLFRKKVAILTMNLHFNIGTALQAYALANVIKSKGFLCDVLTFDRPDRLPFCDKNIPLKVVKNKIDFYSIKENEYDIYIVGSDQVWRKNTSINDYKSDYINIPFLQFTSNWKKVRFSYAASFGLGSDNWQYNMIENKQLTEILSNFNNISVREIESVIDCKNNLDINVKQHIDPTMLLPKDNYLVLCKNISNNRHNGIFKYILHTTELKETNLKELMKKFNLDMYTHEKNSVESWLACIRDAKIIFTDSYHGVIFSIIFNKPFIYYDTRDSGNIRFSTLEKLFNIKYRNISNKKINELSQEILQNPNINYKIYIDSSNSYLDTSLNSEPKLLLNTLVNNINYNVNNKQGWVLFLSSDNYLYYVLNVYKNLLDTHTIYPIYCGYTKEVSAKTIDILNKVGLKTKLLDTSLDLSNIKLKQISNWTKAFTKLALLKNPFNLDKMVYLDSDLGIYKNIDELMNKPHLSAVIDGAPLPTRKPGPYKLGDSVFCSGLFVWDFKNNNDNVTILSSLKNLPINIEWHDQNVLNYFYKNWIDKPELHLSFIYGLMSTKVKFTFVKKNNELNKVKVIHYIAGQGEKIKIPFINSKFYLQSWCDLSEVDKYYKEINESINYFNKIYKLDIPLIPLVNIVHPINKNISIIKQENNKLQADGNSKCYLYF